MSQYGIKETLEVIDLGLAIGYGIGKSYEDGKFQATDIANFMPAVMEIPDALTGIGEVPNELADLSEEEVVQIKNHILNKAADIPGIEDSWMEYARGALLIGHGIMVIVNARKVVPAPAA